jgi:hypothetical protein
VLEVKENIYAIAEECQDMWAWREMSGQTAGQIREEEQESAIIWSDGVKSTIRRNVEYTPELDERLKTVYGKKIRREGISRREHSVSAVEKWTLTLCRNCSY